MKQSIAKRWVKILRSGEIEQAKRHLNPISGKMCCLGVLCNMALIEGICDVEYDNNSDAYRFDDERDILPSSVVKWSGMKSTVGDYPGKSCLSHDNDNNGKSFLEIADIIEKHWEKL